MKYIITCVVFIAIHVVACKHGNNNQHHHEQDDHVHEHATDEISDGHDDEHFIQYTAYSEDYEVFAEGAHLVRGEPATFLAHFTRLGNFKPLEGGRIALLLVVDNDTIADVAEKPVQKGIYKFSLTPNEAGAGKLIFLIEGDTEVFSATVPEVMVFDEHAEVHESMKEYHAADDGVVFIKEQSWKTDFATGYPTVAPIGQVIRSTAFIEPAMGSESIIVSRAGGIVNMTSENLVEGRQVNAGEILLHVTGGSMAENDVSVRFLEARNNFERAEADFERMKSLASENIVSQRELLEAQQIYNNAKAVYENLSGNINQEGQSVASPVDGFIRQILVSNGQFVDAGTPLASVAHSRRLVLTANLPLRYAHALENIADANIKNVIGGEIYSLDELNAKIISGGKATGVDNHLIPLKILIENNGNFIPGSFVEVYLKTKSDKPSVTVPNTSLLEEQGLFFVWVQQTPELFEKRQIMTGLNDGLFTEVKEGLSPDERIVSRGAILIKLAETTGTLDPHAGHVH